MAKESKEDKAAKEKKVRDAKIKENEKAAFLARVTAKYQGKDLQKAALNLNEKELAGVATAAEKKLIKELLKILGK